MKQIQIVLKWSCTLLVFLMAGLFAASGAHAQITTTGDVSPADPSELATTVYIGDQASGSLSITDGSSVTNQNTYLGFHAGVTGEVKVNGGYWNSGSLVAGYFGTGSISLTNNSTMNIDGTAYFGLGSDAQGTVTVNSGSTLTTSGNVSLGQYGTGSLSIGDNGSVQVGSTLYLGRYEGASGTLSVTGTGSLTTESDIYAGHSGTGEISVTGGGSITSSNVILGASSGASGTMTVDGAGSTVNANVTVGSYGTGTLSITNGARVEGYSGNIGSYEGASGTVTVTGTGSAWTIGGNLNLASNGTATLNILDDATVTASVKTTLYDQGNIVLDNGTLNAGNLYDAGESNISGTGTINVTGVFTSGMDLVFDSQSGTTPSFTQGGLTYNLSINEETSAFGIGYGGEGSITIKDGVVVNTTNTSNYLGYGIEDNDGSTGTALVDGAGSEWNTNSLMVGFNGGTGTLAITNGGKVTASSKLSANTTSTVVVDGENSALEARFLYSSGDFSITNGGSVTTEASTYVRDASGATTPVFTIDGAGSTLDTADLYVGEYGKGYLSVTNGALMTSSSNSFIGTNSSSSGIVTVNGEGSAWNSSSKIDVGNVWYASTASLSVSDGASVTAAEFNLKGDDALLTVDVNSSFKVGSDGDWTADLYNQGTVRLVAGAGAASGAYTPLSYGDMTSDGIVQALGGTWDATNHTITVADAATNAVGSSSVELDLLTQQRALITNSSGVSAGAAFLGADASTVITLTAGAVTGDDLTSLETLLTDTDETILSVWNFSVTGNYEDPVYLSLFADSAEDILDLSIWYLSDGTWDEYEAADLAFDGTYASFTAIDLGTYCVTTSGNIVSTTTASAVPVPGTVWLLGMGLAGFAGICRRKAKAL